MNITCLSNLDSVMAKFYVDTMSVWKQRLLSLLPTIVSYPFARRLLLAVSDPIDERDAYLAAMRLEVVWLSAAYLKENFDHIGGEAIDPAEPYVMTSLHYGQWGMYPASLYQQCGIGSQMVMTGRNHPPGSPITYFWERFGHNKQYLSGYSGRLSTENFFSHVKQLRSGVSQIVILDVREQGLPQKELELKFLGESYYLPKTVALLAKRAGCRILPYIGYYDHEKKRHQVIWFSPISPAGSDSETLQRILDLFEPIFSRHPEFYFNVLESHRRPF
jgi:lauroyl/myristoyl acyltransferase